MGFLYNVIEANKSANVVAELKKKGIHKKDGTPIEELPYKEQVMMLAITRLKADTK